MPNTGLWEAVALLAYPPHRLVSNTQARQPQPATGCTAMRRAQGRRWEARGYHWKERHMKCDSQARRLRAILGAGPPRTQDTPNDT